MGLDGCDGLRSAFGLSDHGDEACLLQHHVGEFVHAGGRGGTCGADSLLSNRIDGTHVIDHAIREVDRQWLSSGQHVGDAFVCGIPAGQEPS